MCNELKARRFDLDPIRVSLYRPALGAAGQRRRNDFCIPCDFQPGWLNAAEFARRFGKGLDFDKLTTLRIVDGATVRVVIEAASRRRSRQRKHNAAELPKVPRAMNVRRLGH
jgi:hypothetical protein